MGTAKEWRGLEAPAKINLSLEILGKRPDGFHDLRSVVVPISLCDTLDFEVTADGIETRVTMGDLPESMVQAGIASDENLVNRAARLLKDATGYRGGLRVGLCKRIPVGAGLGGGSSDAAVTLRAANELWGTGLRLDELVPLGARLGCDVPVMLYGRAALMEGVGERITLLDPGAACRGESGWWMVLVNPGFGVPTRDVYRRYESGLTSSVETYKAIHLALREGSVGLAAQNLFNALQPTVFRKYPLLAFLAETLHAEGAVGVLLAGSGATIFALAESRVHAVELERRVKTAVGAWLWSRVARILPDGVTVAHGPLEARV